MMKGRAVGQEAEAKEKTVADYAAKRLARLAAVQGLYRMELTGAAVRDVIRDFRANPTEILGERTEGEAAPSVDQELFSAIVSGVTENLTAVDELVAGSVDTKLSPERLEILLRAILRAGAYELHHHGQIATGVIINDYVDVAHVFFNDREPGLVNAVLDKMGKNLR